MGFDLLNGQKPKVSILGEIGEKVRHSGSFHFEGKNSLFTSPTDLKPCKEKFLKFQYAKDFVAQMPIPDDGESVYALVSGSFIFGDILGPIAKKIGGGCELEICTLSIGQENIDMIDQMYEMGLIKSARFIFSDYFFAHEQGPGGLFRYLMEILDKWPGKNNVSVESVHTKIVMMRNPCHNLVMSGSANLRSSANVEQFELRNSKGLYDWNKSWMNAIHDKFSVTRKPLRSRKNLAGIFDIGG